ncbi:F-box/LRR-repeat protein At4g14103 [Linum perenne]
MSTSSADRISSLPDDVRNYILMFLPLRQAAKSSILSTKWRYLWINLPTLVIDQSFGDEIVAAQRSEDIEGNQFDQILRFLPYSTLENLTIEMSGGFFRLSKTVFMSFSQLKTLRLSYCSIPFSPVSFEGFDRLTVLELRTVLFRRRFEPRLSFKCPLLATLVLDNCVQNLSIVVEEAPILECLYLVGATLQHFEYSHCSLFLKHVVIHESCSTFLHKSESFNTVESLSIRRISKVTIFMFFVQSITNDWTVLICLLHTVDDTYEAVGEAEAIELISSVD